MTIPDYTLRYSKKAKHLQLRLSSHGLEVVIPVRKKVTTNTIEQFIQQKQSWIEKNSQFIDVNPLPTIPPLPTSIQLNAINQIWEIRYLQTAKNKIDLIPNLDSQITLLGDIKNENKCIEKLRTWLKTIAKEHLSAQLILLANETNLNFKELSIRNNTSRWGSCSSEGEINLCCKLLFISPHLMRHVLLHELCHTKVLHHGKAFWRLLTQFDPNARDHAKQLRFTDSQIPRWIF